MHYLARFVVHLHFLLCIVVVREHVNLGNHVESQLVGKFLHGYFFAVQSLTILLFEFFHRHCARSACRLVCGNVYTLNVADVLKRFQHHNHHNGRAVGVCNNSTGTVERVLGVALRHNKWHITVHAERTRIVNHHRPVFGNVAGKVLRHSAAGRCKGNVYALEIVVVLQKFHFIFLAAKNIFVSRAAL